MSIPAHVFILRQSPVEETAQRSLRAPEAQRRPEITRDSRRRGYKSARRRCFDRIEVRDVYVTVRIVARKGDPTIKDGASISGSRRTQSGLGYGSSIT